MYSASDADLWWAAESITSGRASADPAVGPAYRTVNVELWRQDVIDTASAGRHV